MLVRLQGFQELYNDPSKQWVILGQFILLLDSRQHVTYTM